MSTQFRTSDRVLMIGADHLDLPESLHERISVGLARFARSRTDREGRVSGPDITEQVLLRTCARSELYLVTRDPARAFRGICAELAKDIPMELPLESHLRFASSAAAARHLFRTASGLESAALGEAEVLGQVRDALEVAQAAGTVGPLLQRLFQEAIETGRRVRTETELGRGTVSLASAAVTWAEDRIDDGDAPSVLVLGAGQTGRALAHRLSGGPWSRIHIANRTAERACSLAEEVGGSAHTLAEVGQLLPRVDAIFAAVRTDRHLIGESDLVGARAQRDGPPQMIVDLSHPHAIERIDDPAIVDHLDLATLQTSVRDARAERARWIPDAESLVDEAVESYATWARGRGSVPLLLRFRERVLNQALEEAERAGRGKNPEEREALRRLARSVARTILHEPTVVLRTTDPHADDTDVVAAVERLFNLSPDASGASAEGPGS